MYVSFIHAESPFSSTCHCDSHYEVLLPHVRNYTDTASCAMPFGCHKHLCHSNIQLSPNFMQVLTAFLASVKGCSPVVMSSLSWLCTNTILCFEAHPEHLFPRAAALRSRLLIEIAFLCVNAPYASNYVSGLKIINLENVLVLYCLYLWCLYFMGLLFKPFFESVGI